jgi:hypothetical protein
MITENNNRIIILTDAEALDLIGKLTMMVSQGINGTKLRQFSMTGSRELTQEERGNGDATHAAVALYFNVLSAEQYRNY